MTHVCHDRSQLKTFENAEKNWNLTIWHKICDNHFCKKMESNASPERHLKHWFDSSWITDPPHCTCMWTQNCLFVQSFCLFVKLGPVQKLAASHGLSVCSAFLSVCPPSEQRCFWKCNGDRWDLVSCSWGCCMLAQCLDTGDCWVPCMCHDRKSSAQWSLPKNDFAQAIFRCPTSISVEK